MHLDFKNFKDKLEMFRLLLFFKILGRFKPIKKLWAEASNEQFRCKQE
jgi:hypothetical protein